MAQGTDPVRSQADLVVEAAYIATMAISKESVVKNMCIFSASSVWSVTGVLQDNEAGVLHNASPTQLISRHPMTIIVFRV